MVSNKCRCMRLVRMSLMVAGTRTKELRSRWSSSRSYTSCPSPSSSPWCGMSSCCSRSRRGPEPRRQEPGGSLAGEMLQDSILQSIVIITVAVYWVVGVGGGIVADRS